MAMVTCRKNERVYRLFKNGSYKDYTLEKILEMVDAKT